MRSRAAVQHRPSLIEATYWEPRPTDSTKALVNRDMVGVIGLEPVTSSL
jgi:hypothetical protein